jgi:hypothetical protein
MSFCSFLVSAFLVTSKYEEILAIHVFQFTKFRKKGIHRSKSVVPVCERRDRSSWDSADVREQ